MDENKKKYKLIPNMVPDSCWYSNLRSNLPEDAWKLIRKYAFSKSGGYCEICGKKLNGRFDCHEDWSYDINNKVQKLERVMAICPDCHSVIHIGRTQLMGNEDRAIEHFCKVNNCNYAEYRKVLGEANQLHQNLNKVDEWKLDVSYIATIFENKENLNKK